MSERVTITIEDHVAEVTLARPEKYNALDHAMFEAITAAGNALAKDTSVRAVVLCGAGENFCAGIDITNFAGGDNPTSVERMQPIAGTPANYFQSPAYVWKALPVPVIAALQGVVFGGGLQIAMGADVRYASPGAQFSIMEIKWGLIPDMGITTTLRDVVPLDKIKGLTYSGAIIDASDAERFGLVTHLADDPLDAARKLARQIASKSPDAIRAGKALLNEAWGLPADQSLRLEAKLQMGLIGKPNQLEAAAASMEKRAANFRDPE